VWHGDWNTVTDTVIKAQLELSDIISFHNYGNLDSARGCVAALRRLQRPLLCTEYMARPVGSLFDPVLGYFKSEKVAAFNWGFVFGKTMTIMPWDSWWCVDPSSTY